MNLLPLIGTPPPEPLARPKCPNCGKPLTPRIRTNEKQVSVSGGFVVRGVSREWAGDYLSYGAFCTLRCGVDFANAAFRAGYRLKDHP